MAEYSDSPSINSDFEEVSYGCTVTVKNGRGTFSELGPMRTPSEEQIARDYPRNREDQKIIDQAWYDLLAQCDAKEQEQKKPQFKFTTHDEMVAEIRANLPKPALQVLWSNTKSLGRAILDLCRTKETI